MNIRKFENFHILLWLLKDMSWLILWRALGIFMIIPTFGFAIYILPGNFVKLRQNFITI